MITNVSNKELKKNIIEILNHDRYIENEYTGIVENIIKQNSFSEKQKKDFNNAFTKIL